MIATKFDPFAMSLGISFVPVDGQSKRPYHDNWTDPTRNFRPEDFRSSDNVGGRWGTPSRDLVDIDCDIPEACRVCAHTIRKGPKYGRASNPDSHYLVRSPGAKTKKFIHPISSKKSILEIRATGAQSVLPGSLHTSGEPYIWQRTEDPLDFEPIDLLRDVSELAAAALIGSMWKEGARHEFALVLSGFCAKHGMPQDRAERLIKLVGIAAEDHDLTDRLTAVRNTYERFQNGHEIGASFVGLVGEQHATDFAKTLIQWLGLERQTYKIRNEAALLARPAAQFLVKNVLVEGSLVALVAPPDIGKTFAALDFTLSLAAGEKMWLGNRVLRNGPVLYVIGEGVGRFKLRLLAWKQCRGMTRDLPFYWIDQAVPLLDEKATTAFIKEVAPLRPTAIVLDTLSRCLMGGDENSQADMGTAIAVCDDLRARTRALVMLLHHTKKGSMVERGSSVLRGAVDTILTLEEDEEERGLITLSCERQKDAEPFAPISLIRRPIALDGIFNDDGEAESSCILQVASEEDVDRLQSSVNDKRRNRIVSYVAANPGATKNAACAAIGGKKAEILAVINSLIDNGTLAQRVEGRAGRLSVPDLLER